MPLSTTVRHFALLGFLLGAAGCTSSPRENTLPSDARLIYHRHERGIETEIYRIDGRRNLSHSAQPELRLSAGGHFLHLRVEAGASVLGYPSVARATISLRTLAHRRYRLQVDPAQGRFDITVFDVTDPSQVPVPVTRTSALAAHRHPADVSGKLN